MFCSPSSKLTVIPLNSKGTSFFPGTLVLFDIINLGIVKNHVSILFVKSTYYLYGLTNMTWFLVCQKVSFLLGVSAHVDSICAGFIHLPTHQIKGFCLMKWHKRLFGGYWCQEKRRTKLFLSTTSIWQCGWYRFRALTDILNTETLFYVIWLRKIVTQHKQTFDFRYNWCSFHQSMFSIVNHYVTNGVCSSLS